VWVTDVHFTDVDGSFGDFMLEQDLVYEDWSGVEWVTPARFICDLNSIPFFLRPFIAKTILGKTPWLHDYLYRVQPKGVERKMADLLYMEGAIDEGMSEDRAKWMYRGLRVGGWMAWRKNKKLIAKEIA
jgi:hypothetical protein